MCRIALWIAVCLFAGLGLALVIGGEYRAVDLQARQLGPNAVALSDVARLEILLGDEARRAELIEYQWCLGGTKSTGQKSRRPEGCGQFCPQLRSSLLTYIFI